MREQVASAGRCSPGRDRGRRCHPMTCRGGSRRFGDSSKVATTPSPETGRGVNCLLLSSFRDDVVRFMDWSGGRCSRRCSRRGSSRWALKRGVPREGMSGRATRCAPHLPLHELVLRFCGLGLFLLWVSAKAAPMWRRIPSRGTPAPSWRAATGCFRESNKISNVMWSDETN